MPIYIPTYFPPAQANGSIIGATAGRGAITAQSFLAGLNAGNNTTLNQLIVIGHAAAQGGLTQAPGDGSIILGADALQSATTLDGPVIVIGCQALQNADSVELGNWVVIGRNNLRTATGADAFPFSGNVLIGHDICDALTGLTSFDNNTLIGDGILEGQTGGVDPAMSRCVMIGANVMQGGTAEGLQNFSSVLIGYGAGSELGSVSSCVLIGHGVQSAESLSALGACVIIGADSAVTSAFGSHFSTIIIGPEIVHRDIDGSIIIGLHRGSPVDELPCQFFMGVDTGSGSGNLFWGRFDLGSLVIGNVNDTSAEIPADATNILKLLDGTAGSTPPVGGGYFYVSAGALHWVGTSGTDTVLAPA